ncbi:hypothetical protein J6590_086743 [Homalodisca vitripennis]|nr:hypothetical protein J6590_086743 [Homalodisca vitripennis]
MQREVVCRTSVSPTSVGQDFPEERLKIRASRRHDSIKVTTPICAYEPSVCARRAGAGAGASASWSCASRAPSSGQAPPPLIN